VTNLRGDYLMNEEELSGIARSIEEQRWKRFVEPNTFFKDKMSRTNII
jgi:hypothetical protein